MKRRKEEALAFAIRDVFESLHPHAVTVRHVPSLLNIGQTTKVGAKYTVLIRKGLDAEAVVFVMIHELAHVLAKWSEDEDHSDEFGIKYAQLWREIAEPLIEKMREE
jgi:hypothetical protein